VKDFMMQKYDRKSWYIPPSQLPPASPKTELSHPLPERKPLKHLLGEGSPALVVGQEVQYTSTNVAKILCPLRSQ
jgi:Arf-GAP domain and FG repeat-containing protein 1